MVDTIPFSDLFYFFFFALYKLTKDVASWMPFSLEDARKSFLFLISPFL